MKSLAASRWPDRAHWKLALLLFGMVGAWFIIVYHGANWITEQHAWRIRVHVDPELSLPLIPAFTLVYNSIYPLFCVAPFLLRERDQLITLAMREMVAIGIAGIGFVLLPGQLAYAPPPAHLGMWAEVFELSDRLNLDYNLVPSLHVALSVICIEAYVLKTPRWVAAGFRIWGGLIAASTLFTHQHHLLDVVAGYVLALAVARTDWLKKPIVRPAFREVC